MEASPRGLRDGLWPDRREMGGLSALCQGKRLTVGLFWLAREAGGCGRRGRCCPEAFGG
jgi:hypothetical protein